jgi:hypothetical protein
MSYIFIHYQKYKSILYSLYNLLLIIRFINENFIFWKQRLDWKSIY